MKTIVINATAIVSSGSMSILKDFISYVLQLESQFYYFVLFTCTNSVFVTQKNIKVFEINKQDWLARIAWDKKGLQSICEKEGIIPDILVSFQNTCSRFTGKYKNIRQLVYFHNVLPVEDYHWNPFKRQERILFLYRHIYGFFVNRWNKNAYYVVQLQYVKDKFHKKFSNIKTEKVYVIRPNLPKIDIETIEKKSVFENKKIFIYPATPFEYKNHKIILDAVELLKNEEPEIAEKMKIMFTVPRDSQVAQSVSVRRLGKIVNCIGSNPYEELLSYYKRCDALLFPSKIESFGLPLVEAALFGVPIIAADLPYAREVLENYEGATFADVDNAEMWMKQIKQLLQSNKKYKPLTQNVQNTWEEFMNVMNSLLQK